MIKSVNLNGYKPGARRRRERRASSAQNLVAALRSVGMSDEEIRAELEKLQAEKAALKAQIDAAFRRDGNPPSRGREQA